MSSKISVGATVNEAFRFGMKRWQSVIRFFWLPMLLAIALIGGFVVATVDFKAAEALAGTGGMSLDMFKSVLRLPLPVFFIALTLCYLAIFVLMSGGVASIYRLVVHGEERTGIFQLRFDGPAIRVFLSYVILAAINIFIFGVALLIAAALAGTSPFSGFGAIAELFSAAAKAGPGEAAPTELVTRVIDEARPLMSAWVFSMIPLLYLGVKLAPFPAASAAENRLLLIGTFKMTFGHWWSIFLCMVLMMVALILLAVVVEIPYQILTSLGKALANQGAAAGVVGGVITLVATLAYLFYQVFVMAVQLALNAVIYRRLAYGD